MSRPYVALTPAQEAALANLDFDARTFAALVRAAHRAGHDTVTNRDLYSFASLDASALRWRAARDRALELGLLTGDATTYAHHEVTP